MERGVQFLDGSQILGKLNQKDDDKLQHRLFQEALQISPTQQVSAAQCRDAAQMLIRDALCGVQLPSQILDRALKTAHFPSDLTVAMDQASFCSKLWDLLHSVASALKEKPLVVSVLDGSSIKSLLEDEDEFAMLAENLFTELDEEDTGKVSPDTLRTALLQMGLEMGVPIPSASQEADSLISAVLKKHESREQDEIGQAQFAKLLQETLEDLANSLALKPVSFSLDLNVNNGSQLRKMLNNEELFLKVVDGMFHEFDSTKDGKLNKLELKNALESRGEEWGLPSKDSSDYVGQLYNDLFAACDSDNSGEIDKDEFRALLQAILETFAEKLEANPVFMS